MKLEPQDKEPTEVHAEKQQEKKLEYMGRLILNPGHKCFEIEVKTGIVKEAEYKVEAVDLSEAMTGNLTKRRTVVQNPGCIYLSALNKKNARKRFGKIAKENGW